MFIIRNFLNFRLYFMCKLEKCCEQKIQKLLVTMKNNFKNKIRTKNTDTCEIHL